MVLKKFTWPAELTLNLIGGKWKGLLLHHLLTGESRRFGELKRLAPGISAKILAKHLKELESDGLITRVVTGVENARILYAPTLRSRSLAPILSAIRQWGEEHLEAYGPGFDQAEPHIPNRAEESDRVVPEAIQGAAGRPSGRHPNATYAGSPLESAVLAGSY